MDDQEVRSFQAMDKDTLAKMRFTDKLNLLKVKSIIKHYNWPHDVVLSEKDSRCVFLVLQHSPVKIQKEYLDLIKLAANSGRIKLSHFALFIDRIAIQEERPQMFGTQVYKDLETNQWEVFPVEDLEALDERRRNMGLPPMHQYLNHWKIKWPR